MKGVPVTSHPTAAPTSQEALESLLSDILPPQGAWSDDAYLWLTDHTNRPIELTDGHVQDLPMPTFIHQAILLFLYGLFHDHVTPRGGVVMVAALRMRIRPAKFREPDLLLLRDCDDPRGQNRYWMGADLVVEVVSPDNPGRDLVEKRIDYAEAGTGVLDRRPAGRDHHRACVAGRHVRGAWRIRSRRHRHVAAVGRLRGRRSGSVRRSPDGCTAGWRVMTSAAEPAQNDAR